MTVQLTPPRAAVVYFLTADAVSIGRIRGPSGIDPIGYVPGLSRTWTV